MQQRDAREVNVAGKPLKMFRSAVWNVAKCRDKVKTMPLFVKTAALFDKTEALFNKTKALFDTFLVKFETYAQRILLLGFFGLCIAGMWSRTATEQRVNLRMGISQELLILFTVGIERTMVKGSLQRCPFVQELFGARREVMLYQLLPDVLDGLRRGMQHVVSIEAIVAQLVHQDFVGGEIEERGYLPLIPRGGR